MTEAEKAYQYFVIAVPENEEQAKAYFWARKVLQPTLTPPNEWVSRLRELDELYTKLHAVTGFTAEQLLEMFAAGYTLEKHDYSKSFEEMVSLLETAPPNEPSLLKFDVVDTTTGKYPNWERIAREESWAKGLVYCDMDGIAIREDGSLILLDECGNCVSCPPDRFEIRLRLLEGVEDK